MSKIKRVYVSLSADNLHHGHINIITKASSLGELTIGLLTEKAILEKKKTSSFKLQSEKTNHNKYKRCKKGCASKWMGW